MTNIAPTWRDAHRPICPRKFPAYGKRMLEARLRGLVPRQHTLYIVFDWNFARASCRIVVDPDENFNRLDWRFVAGLDVIIIRHHEAFDIIIALADAVLKCNPRRLQCWEMLQPGTHYFKLGGHHAV